MPNFSNSIKILLIASIFLLLNIFCFAQSKVDLEIKAQSSVETIRGGETFSYTFTIRNLSSETAQDVHVMHYLERELTFVSASVSQGTYQIDDADTNSFPKAFRAQFGDIQGYAEVTVTIEVKVNDWGNEDIFPLEALINRSVLSNFPTAPLGEPNSEVENIKDKTTGDERRLYISYPDVVFCDNCADRETNIRPRITLKLLPSKNIAPRIEIVSPKSEAVFVKPLNKQIEVPIVVKASDADGKIVKVTVSDMNNPEVRIILENGQYKYVVAGKTYTTQKELEEAFEDEEFVKSLEVRANLTGKDTYTYVAKKFLYGSNRILIRAVDDGGRSSSQSVEFDIKRDATIEIVSPKSDQVFTPNSTITVETISKINDSTFSQLRIAGTQNDYFSTDTASIPLLRQISKTGNTYKHQYIWKNVKEGTYNLNVMSFDGEISSLNASFTVIVAEPRIIKIFSLKNGQEFEAGKPIKISVDAINAKGIVVQDELELIVDGKSKTTVYNAWKYDSESPNNMILDKDYGSSLSELEKGIHTIQIIARQNRLAGDGAILGKSEIITIKVK